MNNNKNKLRADIKNMYGEFLNNGEVNLLVNRYNGNNVSTIKKKAYGIAYGKYYNSVFENAVKLIKKSPPCPSGAKGQFRVDTYKRAFKAAAQQAGTGVAIGASIGGGLGRGANLVAGGTVATAQGVARVAGAFARLCKGNPKHPQCNGNGNKQNRKQNGKQKQRKSERQKKSPQHLQNYIRN